MARKDPGNPPALEVVHEPTIITRAYTLITPLFGGGVEAGINDPITPIRGTSIRGQLRFWWRATRGGSTANFANDEERLAGMHKREAALWGAAVEHDQAETSATKVRLWIKQGQPRSTPVSDTPDYASFPLRDMDVKEIIFTDWTLYVDVRGFSDENIVEIEAALWAWETFGGLGARTRRGFGALEQNPSRKNLTPALLEQECKTHIVQGIWPEGVPNLGIESGTYLGQRVKLLNLRANGAIQAWNNTLRKLQNFRQKRDAAITRGKRSDWPEADEIRRLWTAAGNGETYLEPSHPGRGFPRAAFGLPIVFHFKDDKKGDPEDSTLQGVGGQRWASRLILRPIRRGDSFDMLSVLLTGSPMPKLELTSKKGHLLSGQPTTDLNSAQVTDFTGSAYDALIAFWNNL